MLRMLDSVPRGIEHSTMFFIFFLRVCVPHPPNMDYGLRKGAVWEFLSETRKVR